MESNFKATKVTKWIECGCGSADDAIRLCYISPEDEDDDCYFFIDFKLHTFPDIGVSPFGSWENFKGYIKNIFHAIKGNDNIYHTQWGGSAQNAKELSDFIIKYSNPPNV